MLTKFEVTNFRGFKEKLSFDLTDSRDYQFNPECVKDGVVNKGIILGPNGGGKSNLGLAILDLTQHLTDFHEPVLYQSYLNAESGNNLAEFRYEFIFDNIPLIYEYGKFDKNVPMYERMTIDGQLVIKIDRRNNDSELFIKLDGAETLKRDGVRSSLISVVTYVSNNALLSTDSGKNVVFNIFVDFVKKMLYFRSLDDNRFVGFDSSRGRSIANDIIGRGNIKSFQEFLDGIGLHYCLESSEVGDSKELLIIFEDKKMPFYDLVSTGTKSLSLFYFWLQRLKDDGVTFLFIDEFDAFYHFKLAKNIVGILKDLPVQVFMTTHNTSLLSNDLFRPDSCFILDKNQIKPVFRLSDRELREAHSLEKMFRGDAFEING